MRRTLTFLAGLLGGAVVVVGLPVVSAQADTTYWVPVSKNWSLVGHGYGHRHGMGQYGAEGAAIQGRSWRDIVAFYYPGTTRSTTSGSIRVLISNDTTADVVVLPASGLAVRDLGDNTRWVLPVHASWTSWRLTPVRDSTRIQYHNSSGWHTWTTSNGRTNLLGDAQFTASTSMTLVTPYGSRRYSGALRSGRPTANSTTRDTINVVSLENYVRGVVPYEMPASWHAEALRAQAVAARTYGSFERAQNINRYYQICDTTACQVYGGASAEDSRSNSAVVATKNVILTYGGRPAFTQFSSSTGGWSSTGSAPYLVAKADPYDSFSGNPVHTWSARVSAATIERSHPQVGRLIRLVVTQRENHGEWGGAVISATAIGTKGTARLSGDSLRTIYGLRTAWFTIEPTAIIARWARLRGTRAAVGPPTARGEYKAGSGDAQDFEHGIIYWSAKTGARELKARVRDRYVGAGGPNSSLGFPTSGMLLAPRDGRKAFFQHGGIWWGPRGAFIIDGPIFALYKARNGAAGSLGYPISDVYPVTGGLRADFEHGSIVWQR
jgi:stage II sporulation protein D